MASGDRKVLITGSTDGLGRCVAGLLSRAGTTLIVHGRDRDRGEQVLAGIRRAGAAAAFYAADFSSLADVRALAGTVRREHRHLDVLVNNAGILAGRGPRRTSRDGYELHFAVNYLSGFLLTRLLLPLLKARPGARIVNIASIGQETIDFDDVMLAGAYSGQQAYRQSKLAQIMFTFDLAEELKASGITVNCLHPATYMNTTMVRLDNITPVSTVEQGAQAVLRLIDSAELSGQTGHYFEGQYLSRANAQAYEVGARDRLRALSFQLVGLAPPAARAS